MPDTNKTWEKASPPKHTRKINEPSKQKNKQTNKQKGDASRIRPEGKKCQKLTWKKKKKTWYVKNPCQMRGRKREEHREGGKRIIKKRKWATWGWNRMRPESIFRNRGGVRGVPREAQKCNPGVGASAISGVLLYLYLFIFLFIYLLCIYLLYFLCFLFFFFKKGPR